MFYIFGDPIAQTAPLTKGSHFTVISKKLFQQRQEAHIKSVSANLLSEEYGARNPTQYAQFEKTAKEQNLDIYIFTFDLADIKNNAFPSDAKFDVYTHQ